MNGTKHGTEAAGSSNTTVGERRPRSEGGSQGPLERGRVLMPERVTTRRVGSPSAESTRFPGEGQSAQGQSGPKTRPKGVVDGQTVNIPSPPTAVEDVRTLARKGAVY